MEDLTKIIVAGEPRSGTSLMCQLMQGLGLTVAGLKFGETNIKDRNPKGFWEVPWVVTFGITEEIIRGEVPVSEDWDRIPIEEDVIKLTTTALLRSELHLIKKVIYCIRDPREVIASQRGQKNYPGDREAWYQYCRNLNTLLNEVTPWGWDNLFHVVNYGDLIFNPCKEVKRICNFLELNVDSTRAAALVDRKLHRSKRCLVKKNKLAEELYWKIRKHGYNT